MESKSQSKPFSDRSDEKQEVVSLPQFSHVIHKRPFVSPQRKQFDSFVRTQAFEIHNASEDHIDSILNANETRNASEMTKVLINKDSKFLKLRDRDQSSDSQNSLVMPQKAQGGDPSQGVASSGLKSMIVSKQTVLNQNEIKQRRQTIFENNMKKAYVTDEITKAEKSVSLEQQVLTTGPEFLPNLNDNIFQMIIEGMLNSYGRRGESEEKLDQPFSQKIDDQIYKGNTRITSRDQNLSSLLPDIKQVVIPEEVLSVQTQSNQFTESDMIKNHEGSLSSMMEDNASNNAQRDLSHEDFKKSQTVKEALQTQSSIIKIAQDSQDTIMQSDQDNANKSSIQEETHSKKTIVKPNPPQQKKNFECLSDANVNIIKLIRKKEQKTPQDLEKLVEFFEQFDFMKAEKEARKAKEQQEKNDLYSGVKPSQTQEQKSEQQETSMTKDRKTVEQICMLTKHLMVPRHEMIFDIQSQGDLFYMLIHGTVHCKVPVKKQLIHLSDEEYQIFLEEYKDDLLAINEAMQMNNQVAKKLKVDLSGQQIFENPYQLEKESLQEHLMALQEKEQLKIVRKYRQKYQPQTHSSLDWSQKHQSQASESLNKSIEVGESSFQKPEKFNTSLMSIEHISQLGLVNQRSNVSSGLSTPLGIKNQKITNQTQLTFDGKPVNQTEQKLIKQNKDYQFLSKLCKDLLLTHKEGAPKINRKYYYVSILKIVKTYGPFESFGELALLTNKRRAAKLETSGDCDAHFAVLSKQNYRKARMKVQNQILYAKMKFLRNFDLFNGLSDSALRSLTYVLQENKCSRGQIIYREGVDPVQNLYFVKQGEFRCFKKLLDDPSLKPDILQTLLKDDVNQERPENEQRLSMERIRQKQNIRSFHFKTDQVKPKYVELCIHQIYDQFGFQELYDEKVQLRQQSVVCLQPDSILVSIDKTYLDLVIRRNPKILQGMISKWNLLLSQRVANKDNVINEQALEQKNSTDEQEKKNESSIEKFTGPQSHTNLVKSLMKTEEDEVEVDSDKEVYFERPITQQKRSLNLSDKTSLTKEKKPTKVSGQSLYDSRFTDFRKSIMSSISHQEYKNVVKIQSEIEKHTIDQGDNKMAYNPIHVSKQKIITSLAEKRIKMPQTLYPHKYQEQSGETTKRRKIALKSMMKNQQSMNGSSSLMLPYINQTNVQISKQSALSKSPEMKSPKVYLGTEINSVQGLTTNQDDNQNDPAFQNSVLTNQLVQRKKPEKFVREKYKDLYDDTVADDQIKEWNKESEIVQGQCSKFMLKRKTSQYTQNQALDNFINHHSVLSTNVLDRSSIAKSFLANQTDQSVDIGSVGTPNVNFPTIKQTSKERHLPTLSNNFDFEKDIEELHVVKHSLQKNYYQSLIGNRSYRSQSNLEILKDSKFRNSMVQEPKSLSSMRRYQASQLLQLKRELSNDPANIYFVQQKPILPKKVKSKHSSIEPRRKIGVYRASIMSSQKQSHKLDNIVIMNKSLLDRNRGQENKLLSNQKKVSKNIHGTQDDQDTLVYQNGLNFHSQKNLDDILFQGSSYSPGTDKGDGNFSFKNINGQDSIQQNSTTNNDQIQINKQTLIANMNPSQLAPEKSKQTSTTYALGGEHSGMPSGMLSTVSKKGELAQDLDIDLGRLQNKAKHIKNSRSDLQDQQQNIKPKIIMRQIVFDQDNFNQKAIASHDLLRQNMIKSTEIKHKAQELKNINSQLQQDLSGSRVKQDESIEKMNDQNNSKKNEDNKDDILIIQRNSLKKLLDKKKQIYEENQNLGVVRESSSVHSMKYILEQQIQKSVKSQLSKHSMSRQSGTLPDIKPTVKTNESIDSFKKPNADLGNDQYMKMSKSYQDPKDGLVNTLSNFKDGKNSEEKSVVITKDKSEKISSIMDVSNDSKIAITVQSQQKSSPQKKQEATPKPPSDKSKPIVSNFKSTQQNFIQSPITTYNKDQKSSDPSLHQIPQIKNPISQDQSTQKSETPQKPQPVQVASSTIENTKMETVQESNLLSEQSPMKRRDLVQDDDDSTLPEYRKNAVKISTDQLEEIKKYHTDNYKNFVIEFSEANSVADPSEFIPQNAPEPQEQREGVLKLMVHSAELNENLDKNSKMDPFCKIKFDYGGKGQSEYMSNTHALGGQTPVWKQEFSKEVKGDQKINIEVHDADPGGKTDFCGSVIIPVADLLGVAPSYRIHRDFTLTKPNKKETGTIKIWTFFDDKNKVDQEQPVILSREQYELIKKKRQEQKEQFATQPQDHKPQKPEDQN